MTDKSSEQRPDADAPSRHVRYFALLMAIAGFAAALFIATYRLV